MTSKVTVLPVADNVNSNSACLLLIVAQKVYDDVLALVLMSELGERVGEVDVICVFAVVVESDIMGRLPYGIAPPDPCPYGPLRIPHIVPYRAHQADDYAIPQPTSTQQCLLAQYSSDIILSILLV